jgi:TetR/AcrR family transcriptional repressor of uid operon
MTMQVDWTPTARRAPERDRRSEILSAAERAFVRYGFHAATMNHVADEAGMSAGNLYRYFPAKEALVEGLCSLDQEQRAASFLMLARSSNVFEAIASALRQHLLVKPPEKARMILEIWAEGTRNARIAAMGQAMDEDVKQGLVRIFEAAKASGEAASSLDCHFAARVLFTMVGGLFKRLAHEADFDVEAETSMVLGVLRALFDGTLRPVFPNEFSKENSHA